jgi:hypothetical protein
LPLSVQQSGMTSTSTLVAARIHLNTT